MRDRDVNRFEIVSVRIQDLPTRRPEARPNIFAGRQIRAAVVGHRIVVPENDKFSETKMASQCKRFLGDPFHQATVTRDDISEVIEQVGAEHLAQIFFGDGHTHAIGESLPQRPGGDFDTVLDRIFRMTMTDGAERTEALDLLDADRLVSAQVQQRIEQHRSMTVAQDKAVAIDPGRIGGVELEMAREQDGSDLGTTKRCTRMTVAGILDGVERQHPDCIGHRPIQVLISRYGCSRHDSHV